MNIVRTLKYRYDSYIIKDYKEIQGYLHADEALSLYRTANKIGKNKKVLEIGSWKGKSTVCIAKGLKRGTTLMCIDPFDATGEEGSNSTYEADIGNKSLREQFELNLKERNLLSRVKVYQGFSDDFVDQIDSIDFLFIDGDHSKKQTLRDYNSYSPKIVSGGYLALHDYYPDRKEIGPTWVIENVILPSNKYTGPKQNGTLWTARKK